MNCRIGKGVKTAQASPIERRPFLLGPPPSQLSSYSKALGSFLHALTQICLQLIMDDEVYSDPLQAESFHF